MLIKRKLRSKREITRDNRRITYMYTHDERKFAKILEIYPLLNVDNIPSQEILNLLRKLQLKQMMLRQMIVSKYAVNSLDIHFILAKALELYTIESSFIEYL